jgi:hypothetical protein
MAAITAAKSSGLNWCSAAVSLLMRRHLITEALQAHAFDHPSPSMPVNTAALKTFVPAVRRQLIEAVGRKLDLLLHQASADTLTTAAGPIEELRQQQAHNRQELLERVAYSWFKRLAALRCLDARLWHPSSARVLMLQTESEIQPEVLKLLRSGSLPAELQPH